MRTGFAAELETEIWAAEIHRMRNAARRKDGRGLARAWAADVRQAKGVAVWWYAEKWKLKLAESAHTETARRPVDAGERRKTGRMNPDSRYGKRHGDKADHREMGEEVRPETKLAKMVRKERDEEARRSRFP